MDGSQSIQPDAKLQVVLSAASWNTVMQALAQAPYHLAAPLISEIQRQCMRAPVADFDG
jgi:hypothetical protein